MLLHELSRVVGPEVVAFGLLAVVAYLLSLRLAGPTTKTPSKETFTPKIVTSSIPYIGHIIAYVKNGHHHFSSLCMKTKLPVFAIDMLQFQVNIVQPQLMKELPKVRGLGFGPLILRLFGQSLDLGEHTYKLLRENDHVGRQFPKQMSRFFRQELIPDSSLQRYVGDIDPYLQEEICRLQGSESFKLETWVFGALVGSLGKALWGGYEGPFGDAEFIHHLRIFMLNISHLSHPVKFMIDKTLTDSRQFVRRRLEQFSFEQYSETKGSDQGFLARVRQLCLENGASTEGWTDYQLLLITGLGPNVMVAAIWLIHHIVEDEERQRMIQREIDQLVESSDEYVDVGRISDECPLLQATWYEVLRYHGGFSLGRYVHEDTTLDGRHRLEKGSVVLAPLKPHHRDRGIWGAGADEFHPERFLKADGTIDEVQRRQIRIFGLFGTLCPGRFLAVHLSMMLVVRLFREFDVVPLIRPHVLPEERKEDLAGLPFPAKEMEFGLRDRSIGKEHIKVCFKRDTGHNR